MELYLYSPICIHGTERDNIIFTAETDSGFKHKQNSSWDSLSDNVLPIFDNAKAKCVTEKRKPNILVHDYASSPDTSGTGTTDKVKGKGSPFIGY